MPQPRRSAQQLVNQDEANSKHSSEDESTDMCRAAPMNGHGLGSSAKGLVQCRSEHEISDHTPGSV